MHALESLITWCITVLECDLEIWFIVEKTINFSASKNRVLLRLLLCYCFFSVILVCRFIMRNAAIIYFFFFWNITFYWMVQVSIASFTCNCFYSILDFFILSTKILNKKTICESRENFDITISCIHQHRENNPLFSYYFKTSKW